MPASETIIYFDVTLTPSRSLSPRAFTITMAIIAGVSFLAGLSFMRMGAYPVIGFFGLDALAIWLAFRYSFRQLEQKTCVRITAESIELRHFKPGKDMKHVSIPTAFAQVRLANSDRRPSELSIAHSGTAWVIGRFLTPSERRSLQSALTQAIQRARAERYSA